MKKILRRVMPLMPASVRQRMIREFIRVPDDPPAELKFKVAETKEELEAAFSILHDSFVAEGYMNPHESGLRLTKYHALSTTTILIATWNDRVVGTISIIRDGIFGLPLESAFDLKKYRERYTWIAEISSLAVHKDFRQSKGPVFFGLMKYMYEYCLRYMRVQAIVISVHPKWKDFYEGIVLFNEIPQRAIEKYDFANGNPAVALILDLEQAFLRYLDCYGKKAAVKNVFAYFARPTPDAFYFPRRLYYKPTDMVMSPELLNYFFAQKTDVFNSLSDKERALLRNVYPFQNYHRVLPKTNLVYMARRQTNPRFATASRASAEIGQDEFQISILNASISGLRVRGLPEKLKGQVVRLEVIVADNAVAEIKAVEQWRNDIGETGLAIVEADNNWARFVSVLHADFQAGRSIQLNSESTAQKAS